MYEKNKDNWNKNKDKITENEGMSMAGIMKEENMILRRIGKKNP